MKKAKKNDLFERPEGGNRAILVHLNLRDLYDREDLTEFQELALSAGAQPVAVITGARQTPEAKYFVGSGKANEIKSHVAMHHADLVLFNHPLTPSQERNLEALFQCRVLDRTTLILDIFAQRARTFEGKLQVELAQLRHLATRLVRGWSHLERQKGGIGLRGPGETQLETDRRLIRDRIKSINQRLEKVCSQRDQSRRARKKAELPTVSIVGYTNAGKSSLFNALTTATVYTADQLFATLDPTLRRLQLPNVGKVILADTVGFIRHLPHDLVQAFRATLEETLNADLLLHVVDVTHSNRDDLVNEVNFVLEEIDASDIPQLIVYNKIDLQETAEPHIQIDEQGTPKAIWASAKTNQGLDLITAALSQWLAKDIITETIDLSLEHGRLRAAFYAHHAVVHEESLIEGGWKITVRLPKRDYQSLLRKYAFS